MYANEMINTIHKKNSEIELKVKEILFLKNENAKHLKRIKSFLCSNNCSVFNELDQAM